MTGTADGAVVDGSATDVDDRPRAAWRVLVPMLAALVVQIAGLGAVFATLAPTAADAPWWRAVATLVLSAGALVASAGVVLAVAARLDRRRPADYGFELSAAWLADLLAGAVVGVVMVSAALAYLHVRGYATLALDPSGVGGVSGAGAAVVALVALLGYVLANNLAEEVLFRGVVLRNLLEGLSGRALERSAVVVVATALSLALFGVWHLLPPNPGGLADVTTSAVLAVVFVLGYLLTGQLALPVGTHFGGVAVLSAMQEEVLGLTLPSLFVLEFPAGASGPSHEIALVRAVVGVALVLGWVRLAHGDLSLADVVPRSDDA